MRKKWSLIGGLTILILFIGALVSGNVLASSSQREAPKTLAAIQPGTFTLKESLNKVSWTNILGNLSVGYSMVLDPGKTYEYITVASLTASPALTTGLHPIYFDTFRVEESFWVYWEGEGVNASATGDAAIMWDILNGDLPMFYIKYDGSSYSLVDGYLYETSGQTSEEPWRVNGDLPLDTYHFGGWVTDVENGEEYLNIQMTFTKVATVSLTQEASSCGYVDVLIHLANVHDLYALDLVLDFDPEVLEVVDLLLDDPGTTGEENPGVNIEPISGWFNVGYPVINDADNTFGVIQYTATQLNTAAPAEGEGDVARIRFKALTGDPSTVTVASAELSDRDGFLVGRPVSLQSVTVTPNMAPTNVDLDIIRLNPSTVQLTWPKEMLDAGVEYNLYRSTLPYFDIGDPEAVEMNDTAFVEDVDTVTYDDPVLGDVTNNYFYALQTVCSNDLATSPVSDQVGKFEFELFETATTDFTWIGLVLELSTELQTASELASHIETNSNSAVSVLSVSGWDSSSQQINLFLTADPENTFDFPTFLRFPYRISVDVSSGSSTIWAQVGKLPPIDNDTYTLYETATTDFNWILQPLDLTGIGSVTDLVQHVEVNASQTVTIDTVSNWNPISQQYDTYYDDDPGSAFTTRFGYPYRLDIDVTTGNETIWP